MAAAGVKASLSCWSARLLSAAPSWPLPRPAPESPSTLECLVPPATCPSGPTGLKPWSGARAASCPAPAANGGAAAAAGRSGIPKAAASCKAGSHRGRGNGTKWALRAHVTDVPTGRPTHARAMTQRQRCMVAAAGKDMHGGDMYAAAAAAGAGHAPCGCCGSSGRRPSDNKPASSHLNRAERQIY